MRSLVVGYGSIGSRHARLLEGMGHEVAVVSRRAGSDTNTFADVRSALASGPAGYVVVADETARHRTTLQSLIDANFSGPVLVEKPLWEAGAPPL